MKLLWQCKILKMYPRDQIDNILGLTNAILIQKEEAEFRAFQQTNALLQKKAQLQIALTKVKFLE